MTKSLKKLPKFTRLAFYWKERGAAPNIHEGQWLYVKADVPNDLIGIYDAAHGPNSKPIAVARIRDVRQVGPPGSELVAVWTAFP